MKKEKNLVPPSEVVYEVVGGNHAKNQIKEEIQYISLENLKEFKNHPFKVEDDMELFELMKSIETEGVLVPILARTHPEGEGYEIVSGHRRKAAAMKAGFTQIPVIVRQMSDDEAVIDMVDGNLQREHIRLSEKAFACRMKLEAMNRKGKRNDLTLGQVGQKLVTGNYTLQVHEVELGKDERGLVRLKNCDTPKIDSRKELAQQMGESERQITRLIRLTYLIPQILKMVDEEKIAFTVAVELSYLKEEEQYELYAVMDLEQCTPSLSQANRLKRISQMGCLEMDEIYEVLEEEMPNQKEQIKIKANVLEEYFPKDFTPKQKVELIEQLVKEWHEKQMITKSGREGRAAR